MLAELITRFLIGGAVVSLFSVIGAMITNKRVAGVFSGAPSVALASLVLAYVKYSPAYVAHEGRSMILGAVAFIGYAVTVAGFLERKTHVIAVTAITWSVWFAIAFGLWSLVRRG